MAPSTISAIGKKKRRREKREGASTSTAALGVHAEKEEGVERKHTGARCMHSSFSYLNFS
jgi:hypothetical protein